MRLMIHLRWYLWLLEGVWSALRSWAACLVPRRTRSSEPSDEWWHAWRHDRPGVEDQFHTWNEDTLTNLSVVRDP